MRSTSYTFGYILALYLGGVGLGSLAAHLGALRRAPATRSFLVMQAAIPLYAAAALAALVWTIGSPEFARPLRDYLVGYAGPPLRDLFTPLGFIVYVLVPAGLMGPPTLLMGLSFGSLQRAVQTDVDGLGRRVGWLQTANIGGAVIGTLITGFVLLDRAGTSGTLRALVLASAPLAWLMLRPAANGAGVWRHPAVRGAATAAIVAAGFALVPAAARRVDVFANGLGQSVLPFGGIHTVLGALPALMHPAPADVAVIGLGSGDTTYAVGGRPETVWIDSVGIVAPAVDSLRQLASRHPTPGLRELLSDPRVHHRLTDGRVHLLRSTRRYDIIEADALRPLSAYSGNLYSLEYFTLLRSRLKPGGFAVTWTPTVRVVDTFAAAFPHVLVNGYLAVGSDQPIAWDPDAIRGRLAHPFTAAHYRAANLDMLQELDACLRATPRRLTPEQPRAGCDDLNHDLFPRDEFNVRRRSLEPAR